MEVYLLCFWAMYIATETRGSHLLFAVGAVVLACSNFSGFAGSLLVLVYSYLVSGAHPQILVLSGPTSFVKLRGEGSSLLC